MIKCCNKDHHYTFCCKFIFLLMDYNLNWVQGWPLSAASAATFHFSLASTIHASCGAPARPRKASFGFNIFHHGTWVSALAFTNINMVVDFLVFLHSEIPIQSHPSKGLNGLWWSETDQGEAGTSHFYIRAAKYISDAVFSLQYSATFCKILQHSPDLSFGQACFITTLCVT